MRTKRKVESREERIERLSQEAKGRIERTAADEAAVDEKIRRNLALYGP